MREWRTKEEVIEDQRNRRKFYIEAWAIGFGMAAMVLIVLSYALGWR